MPKHLHALVFFPSVGPVARGVGCVITMAVILAGTAAALGAGPVVYREIFPRDGSGSVPLAEGWQLHGGATAQPVDAFISGADGRPEDAAPVNSNPSADEREFGWAFFFGDDVPDSGPALLWTDEIGSLADISSGAMETVSWYQANNSAGTEVRAVVGVDSQWYATVDTLTNSPIASGHDFDSQAEPQTVDMFTAQWYSLTFNPTTVLSLGATATSLPIGQVTGGGLYFEGITDDAIPRVDTFAINVVPEPSTLAIFGLGGLIGLVLLVRRRTRAASR